MPALSICTACPPVSAPSAVTGSSSWRSSHSRFAPSRAIVCSGTIEPRRRLTSSSPYSRSIPSQRASVILVIPLAEVGARALGGLGRREHLCVALFLREVPLDLRFHVDGHGFSFDFVCVFFGS